MATYYGTYGQKVQYLASDPSDPQIGQVWYNSTSAVLKVRDATTVGTWAAGGNMNAARTDSAGFGTQTAGLVAGGYSGSPTNGEGITELYNGTSWTTSPASLNTIRYTLKGTGSQTAGMATGGYNTAYSSAAETFNGTSWTTITSMPSVRAYHGMFGTQTALIGAAGYVPPASTTNTSVSWNGSAWSAGGNLGTSRYALAAASASPQTAGLVFGGETYPQSGVRLASTESYNGTSWTTVNSLNTARRSLGGSGIQTASLAFGGNNGPGAIGATELWNGTSWTSNPTGLATARSGLSGAGTQTVALAFGGNTGAYTVATEEWTGPGTATTKTVTVS